MANACSVEQKIEEKTPDKSPEAVAPPRREDGF